MFSFVIGILIGCIFVLLFIFKSPENQDILKDTWHICEHDFETKAVDEKMNADYLCKKCGVQATNRIPGMRGDKAIIVSPKTNMPVVFEPWGINYYCKSITVRK